MRLLLTPLRWYCDVFCAMNRVTYWLWLLWSFLQIAIAAANGNRVIGAINVFLLGLSGWARLAR